MSAVNEGCVLDVTVDNACCNVFMVSTDDFNRLLKPSRLVMLCDSPPLCAAASPAAAVSAPALGAASGGAAASESQHRQPPETWPGPACWRRLSQPQRG